MRGLCEERFGGSGRREREQGMGELRVVEMAVTNEQ